MKSKWGRIDVEKSSKRGWNEVVYRIKVEMMSKWGW